jgi:hypothetical protein
LARRLRSASQTVAISSTTWPTADGSVTEAANAADALDARVIAAARATAAAVPITATGVGEVDDDDLMMLLMLLAA